MTQEQKPTPISMNVLAMLVRRLVHALRKAAPGNDLADQAMGYLTSYGLAGTFLHGSSAFVPEDVPAGLNPGKASVADGTSASACHPENVPAPAAVAVPDFENWRKREYPWLGPVGDGVQIAREAWSAALAATPAAAAPTPVLVDGMKQDLMALYNEILKQGRGMHYWNYAAAVLERYRSAPAPTPAADAPMVDMTPPATSRDRWMYEQGRLAERDTRTPGSVAADARDAGRYRWLRNESWACYNLAKKKPEVALVAVTRDGAGNVKTVLAEDAMDEAIDAAIAAQAAQPGGAA